MILNDVLAEVEASGVELRLAGDRVRIWFPKRRCRQQLTRQLAFLRSHRAELTALLQARSGIPAMPPDVQLIEWNLKDPPILFESSAVVTNADLFARTTLEQLRSALANQKRWVGWSIPQLVQRLAQVGVIVRVEMPSGQQ